MMESNKNPKKKKEITFYASVIEHHGKKVMMIRGYIEDPKIIKPMADEIVKNNSCSFAGKLTFNNKLYALAQLKQSDLY